MQTAQPDRQWDTGAIDLIFVVLLLQSAIGIFTALTQLILALATGSAAVVAPSLLFAFAWPGMVLVLGAALVRRHRSARTALFCYESVCLLAWMVGLLTSRGGGFALMPLTVGALLPVGIIGLLRRRDVRAALSGSVESPPSAGAASMGHPLRRVG